METKRSVQHYRHHELVCEAIASNKGWQYSISVVSHHGDDSKTTRKNSDRHYATDIEALHEAELHGHGMIDALLDDTNS